MFKTNELFKVPLVELLVEFDVIFDELFDGLLVFEELELSVLLVELFDVFVELLVPFV
jgi:hypothetical protein